MVKQLKRRQNQPRLDAGIEPGMGWIIPVALIVITLLALFPLCGFDFTTWDDSTNVANNELLNPPGFANLTTCWTQPQLAIYIPMTYTVWSFIATIARNDAPNAEGIWLNPHLFHTANVIVHLLAVLVVYALLRRIVGKQWPAAAGAMIFAVHPLQVESVGWVAGMKDVLCGFFMLAALWKLVACAQSDGRRRWIHYGLATFAYALALFSKPSAMATPLLALLLVRFICKLPWKQVAMTVGPWFLMAAPIAIIAKLVQPVITVYDGGKPWLRPLIATDALAFYVGKILLPIRLAVQYDHYPQVVIAHRWLYWSWIIPVLLVIIALLLRKHAPWVWISLAIIPAATLPVLGLVPFQYERLSVVADHYLYVAMLGPAMLVAYALPLIPKKIAIASASIVVLTFATLSNIQTWTWQDTESLFTHELQINPNSFAAYNSLASWEIMHHHPDKAETFALQAIEKKHDFAEAWGTLGVAQSTLGKRAQAAEAFKHAYDLAPGDETAAIAASHLGATLAQMGNRSDGEKFLLRAIELNPKLDEAHLNLAVLYANSNRIPDALNEAVAAARVGPGNPQNHLTLALLLHQTGQRNQAITEYRRTLELAPNSKPAQMGLRAAAQQSAAGAVSLLS